MTMYSGEFWKNQENWDSVFYEVWQRGILYYRDVVILPEPRHLYCDRNASLTCMCLEDGLKYQFLAMTLVLAKQPDGLVVEKRETE